MIIHQHPVEWGQIATMDTGSRHTHVGKRLSSLFQPKLHSSNSYVQIGDRTTVRVKGIMNANVQLGQMQRIVPFRVTDELLCDCILGVDFMRAFQMSIDSGNDTWSTPDGQMHQCDPYKRDTLVSSSDETGSNNLIRI